MNNPPDNNSRLQAILDSMQATSEHGRDNPGAMMPPPVDLESVQNAQLDNEFAQSDAMQKPELALPEPPPMMESPPNAAPQPEAAALAMPPPAEPMMAAISPEKLDANEERKKRYEKILEDYRKFSKKDLSDLQQERKDALLSSGMLQAGSQIAQAFAAGHGGKIGSNEEGVKLVQGMGAQKVADYKEQQANLEERLKGLKTESDASTEMQKADKNSDISKFARQQAVNAMMRLSGSQDPAARDAYLQKFEGMSALDLEKVGFKGLSGMGTIRPYIATDRTTMGGHPVKFDPNTGTYIDGLTNQSIAAGEMIPRDIARINRQTENYGYVTPTGMHDVGASTVSAQPDASGKIPDVTDADINKVNPKVYKEVLLKVRKDFEKDPNIMNARKMNANTTNILTKLDSLDPSNPKIDAGLKEALAAQAGSISVGGGRLAEGVIKEFGGAGGLQNKINRYVSEKGPGVMTPEDVKFFRTFAIKMQKAASQDAQDAAGLYVGQIQQMPIGREISEDNAAKLLNLDKVMKNTTVQKYKEMKTPKDAVWIQGPSGEKKLVNKSAADKYLKTPGYQKVEGP